MGCALRVYFCLVFIRIGTPVNRYNLRLNSDDCNMLLFDRVTFHDSEWSIIQTCSHYRLLRIQSDSGLAGIDSDRPTGTAEELESRRRKCFELLDSGKTATEIAEILGVARTSIQRWKAMVRENGKRALKAIPQHVPEFRMTPEQQKELGKIITDGALAAGYPTDLWTTARITEVI